jgi:hypothetical protein
MTRIQQSGGTGAVWMGLRLLCCAGLLHACSGDPDRKSGGPQGVASGGQSGSGAMQGQGDGGSSDFGNAPGMSGGGGTGGTMRPSMPKPGDLPADCSGDTQTAKQVDVDMYIMLDRSASMLGLTGPTTGPGQTKWDAIRDALSEFLADPASAGLGVGLQYFPLAAPGKPESCMRNAECGTNSRCITNACVPPPDATMITLRACITAANCPPTDQGCAPLGQCSIDPTFVCFGIGRNGCQEMGDCNAVPGACEFYESCTVSDYATPAVEIGVLPDNAMPLLDSLAMRQTNGATPTPPALEGALVHASDHAAANPTHRVIAVLATDGLPTQCIPDSAITDDLAGDVAAEVAMRGLALRPPVETYVIGVFAPEETSAMPNLDKIARAGGTESPFIVDASQDVKQQFLDALAEIRGGSLACEFNLPEAPDGKMLDYKLVNVELTDKDGTRVLEYVGEAGNCADSEIGWFYDKDPLMNETPTKISVCDSTCEVLRNASDASVEIRLGCKSIVPM